jgi:alginate O-acetyltransferase complex protein AlgI
VRVALTFVVVLITWVFFRAADLPAAGRYLSSMFAMADVPGTAHLLAGIVYQPYYLLTFVAAAIVTWACPQTWDWSRTITAPKAVAVAAAFVMAAVMLTTQAFNPFIYFIF